MDFREEYRKSMESSSPDRQAMDRMKAAVLAKIEAGEGQPGIPGEKRRPISRFAYIGGAAAACAIIAVSAATILPNVGSNNMVHDTTANSSIAAEKAASAETSAEPSDNAAGADSTGNTETSAAAETLESDIITEDAVLETTDSASIAGDLPDNGVNDINGGKHQDADYTDESYMDEDDGMPNPEAGANITDDSEVTQDSGAGSDDENPCTGAPDDFSPDSEPSRQDPDKGFTGEATKEEFFDETTDIGSFEISEEVTADATEEFDPTEEVYVAKIVFGRDFIAFDGERYKPVSAAPPDGPSENAFDPVNKTEYTFVRSGDVIAVYLDGKLIGVYQKM